MTDSPEPFWPGSREVEALVSRAVAERLDPLRGQLTAVARAIAILAERVPLAEQVDALSDRVEALAERLGDPSEPSPAAAEPVVSEDLTLLVERIGVLEHAVRAAVEGRDGQTDELRQALAVAVSHAVAKLDQGRGLETERVLEEVGTLAREADARHAQAEELRQGVTAAIEEARVSVEGAVTSDGARLLEHVAALEARLTSDAEARRAQLDALGAELKENVGEVLARSSDASGFERSLAEMEAARAADANRAFEQVAALEGPLTRDAIARQAQLDDLRHTVATTIDQAVSRIETARAAEAAQLVDQVTQLVTRAGEDARRRDEQAAALLQAVDERLQALHVAGAQAGEEREERQVARLEAISAELARVLLTRIDERTASMSELSALPPMVAAEVQNATAAALAGQVEPLVVRLVEAVDSLAHEGGRIEALARSHAGEARAVEERVGTMFIEVAERAESAVDRSRARIAEGQVALGGRFESIVGELLSALNAAAERLEARLTESAEGLRAAGGHQNGALLDAVTRSSQQLAEGLGEVRAALFATGTDTAARGAEADRRAEALAERIEGLRSTVESIRHDPRIEALVVEQVAAREAQLAAIQAVSARIDEIGPLVARALLTEVERAVRAANAAEEAVSNLRPEALRTALTRASERASEEIHRATQRFDQGLAALAEKVEGQMAALADGQARAREDLAEMVQGPGGSASARLDHLDRSLAEALGELGGVVAATREQLVTLTGQALERTASVADELARNSGAAIDDLRASQTVLREAVQDGAHKAELAALDIRGLRDRLTPHLVALAEATTRRAEADQAGFDAVLARLDQLLAQRVR